MQYRRDIGYRAIARERARAAPVTHWDFPAPHVIELGVRAADIDAYGHVNNSVYLTWLDRAPGRTRPRSASRWRECTRLRRGMAAQRIEIDYLRAALAAR